MQIKVFTVALLWLFSLPLAAAGGNLLTEWTPQKNAGPGKRLLPEWRFSDWGKRQADGKIPARKVTTALVDGKVQVTLENTGGDHAVNILFRTYPLALKENIAIIGSDESSDNTERSGFSATGRSEKGYKFLVMNVQIDAAEDLLTVERFTDGPQFDQLVFHSA